MSVFFGHEFGTWKSGDGSQRFLIPSNAALSKSNKKLGESALELNGSAYAYTPSNIPETETLDVQAWVYLRRYNPNSGDFSWSQIIGNDGENAFSFRFLVAPDGRLLIDLRDTTGASAGFASNPGIVELNVWQHIRANKSPSQLRLYKNGAMVGSVPRSARIRASATAIRLGMNDRGIWATDGNLQSVRVSTDPCGDDGYIPNSAPFPDEPDAKIYTTAPPSFSSDIYRSGRGVIAGTVKIHGTSDVPAARKVGLFLRRTMERVAITWSDPVTGVYTFSGLQTIEPFFVASLDHTLAFDGVLHDNIMAVAP